MIFGGSNITKSYTHSLFFIIDFNCSWKKTTQSPFDFYTGISAISYIKSVRRNSQDHQSNGQTTLTRLDPNWLLASS